MVHRALTRRMQTVAMLHDPFVINLSSLGKQVKYKHLTPATNVIVTQKPVKKSRVTILRHGSIRWVVCWRKKRQRRDSNTRGKIPLT